MLAYGLTAKTTSRPLTPVRYFTNVLTHRPNINDRENALKILHLETGDLTWEKMYELNVGLDVGFLVLNRVNLIGGFVSA